MVHRTSPQSHEAPAGSPEDAARRQTVDHIGRLAHAANDVKTIETADDFIEVGERMVLQAAEDRHLSVTQYYEAEQALMTRIVDREFDIQVGELVGQIDVHFGATEGPRFEAVIYVGQSGVAANVYTHPDPDNPYSPQALECEDAALTVGVENAWEQATVLFDKQNTLQPPRTVVYDVDALERLNTTLGLWQR